MRLKHLYLTLPFLLAATAGKAQQSNIPNTETAPGGTSNALWTTPAEVSTAGDVSYIRSYVPMTPVTDTAAVNSNAAASGSIREQTAWLDGFMQPFQTVTTNAAVVEGQARHLVGVAYNYPGQEARSYLPYASGSKGLQSNAFQAQRSYYGSQHPGEGYTSFSKIKSTSTASQYASTSYLPGKSQIGQDRGTVTQSLTNAANEILIWDIDAGGMPIAAGYYGAQQLFGQQTIAPTANNNTVSAPQSKAFKDKDGKLIVKMVAAGNSNNVIRYEYTYYVYDEKGNLRYTLTPKAFKYYQDHGTLATGNVLHNLCFQYRYDAKGRLIAAQKPGEDGFTWLVYDAKDRPVMRQTPNERLENKWEITFYDPQNRVKATSLFRDNSAWGQEEWQGMLDNAVVAGAVVNTIAWYLATAEGELAYPADNNTGDISDNEMMSYTWYDDYRMADPDGNRWAELNGWLDFNELVPEGEAPLRSERVYGAVTGSKVRILAAPGAQPEKTGEWRSSLLFYDNKGRTIYSSAYDLYQDAAIHVNISGTQYDFANRVRMNKHLWYNDNSSDALPEHREWTKYTYDALSGALLNTKHKVDDGLWNTLNSFTYDDMGRVRRKSMGNGAEVQDMSYNIRGQLTGINGRYAETGDKENKSRSFGEAIRYDYGFNKNRYDGKMAGIIWRGAVEGRQMAYGYDYTQHQLLLLADFNFKLDANTGWQKNFLDFSVRNLGYDENGNITSMHQRGVQPGTGPVDMDVLSYTYQGNSNRLSAVTDGGVPDYGAGDFQDHGSTGTEDYDYDPNGNLQLDGNKGINEKIAYTFFNKPVQLKLDNGVSFNYSYDAAGGKVQELVQNDPDEGDIATDYIGNAVYENDRLKYVMTPEGRTVYAEGESVPFKEEYFAKDHLGNVRSTISAATYSPRLYLADYEIASASLENLLFDNIDELRETKPGEYRPSGREDISIPMAAQLNGSDAKTSVGSALLLHVMAGDQVDLKVNDYYDYYDPKADKPVDQYEMVQHVAAALTAGYNGFKGENRNTALVDKLFSNSGGAYAEMMGGQTDYSKPQAFLNYVVFDEHMNLVPEASGAFQATHQGDWGQIGSTEAITIPVNGYLAVYLSNATRRNVYFDGLQVALVKGRLLEENHYYPHGLPITGLSSEDPGLLRQRRRYQGNEYIRSGGLNWMSFGARQYDPQTGRFLSVDPLAAFGGQDRYSPYAAMGNMPEMMIDPDGLQPRGGAPYRLEKAQAATPEAWENPFARVMRGNKGNSGAGATFGGGAGGGGFDTWGGLNAFAAKIGYWANVTNAVGDMTEGNNVAGLGADGNIAWQVAATDVNSSGYQTAYTVDDPEATGGQSAVFVWNSWQSGGSGETAKQQKGGWRTSVSDWIGGIGVAASGVEIASGATRLGWLNGGLRTYGSGSYQPFIMGARQFRSSTFSLAKGAKGLGNATFVLGVLLDGYGALTYVQKGENDPNALHPAKAGLNTTIGVWGFINPATAAGSAIYYGIDAFYPGGWEGAMGDQSTLNQENSFNPNWQLWPGAMKQ